MVHVGEGRRCVHVGEGRCGTCRRGEEVWYV